MTRRPTALALLLLPLAACSDAGADAAKSAARDSAGIRIVESTAPVWDEGEGWRLSPQPALAIGGEDAGAAYQFGHVVSALRLSGGGFVVADGQAGELRIFDAAGKHLRTSGKKGGGPGEFGELGRLFALPGDSVATWDYTASRLSVFTGAGEFARNVSVRPEGRVVPSVDGVFPDGSLLVNDGVSLVFSQAVAARRDTAHLFRFAPDGTLRDTVGRYAGTEMVTLTGGEGKNGWALRSWIPFGGRSIRAVHGGQVFLADNARYEVSVRDPGGRVVRLIRRAGYQPRPLTEDEIGAHKREQLKDVKNATGMERRMREEMSAAMPYPKVRAPFEEMRVDRAGNVWLRDFPAPGAETVNWTVFDAEGRLLGEVTMPEKLRVTDIGADYVLGVGRDELDVQRVEMYRLEKPDQG